MAVIHPSLFFVMQSFPNHKDALRQLYRTDKTFRDICRNYKKCAEALHYWSESNRSEAAERHREYSALLQELELEITKNLEELAATRANQGKYNNN